MKGSISRKRQKELFDMFDRSILLMEFDETGKRTLTYGGLNPFHALAEVAFRAAKGMRVLLFLGTSIQETRGIEHLDDVPKELVWSPGWEEMKALK